MDYVILGFLLAVMLFIMILGQWVQKERKYKKEINQLKAEISAAEDRIRGYRQKLIEYASQQELLLDYKKMYADEVQMRLALIEQLSCENKPKKESSRSNDRLTKI